MPTLAYVLDRLSSIDDAALRLGLQRDVRRFATLVRKDGDPARIDVDRRVIAGLLAGLVPSDLGRCTAKRLANFRANVRKAVHLTCPSKSGGASAATQRAWGALWRQMPADRKWAKIRARKVVNYCLAHDKAPTEVPADCFAGFQAWCVATSLAAKAETAARDAVVAYNGLVAEGLLPGPAIALPAAEPTFTLPLSVFPSSFQAEVEAYLAYMADPICATAPKGARKPKAGSYRRGTILFRERVIRYAASLLVDAGVPVADITNLTDLVVNDRFALMMRRFHEREASRLAADAAAGKRNEWGDEKTSSAYTIAKTVRSIICGWHSPMAEAVNYLNRVVASTKQSVATVNDRAVVRVMRKRGLTAKIRRRLNAIDDQALRRLLDLPSAIAREIRKERSERCGKVTARMACRFQVAVAIGLMWLTPVRLENLRTIDVERHLERAVGSRKGAVMNLVSVKSGNPITIELTAEYLALLDEYLTDYRPVLESKSDALFPGRSAGGFLHPTSLARRISRDVSTALGCRFNCHLFRHLIATRIVRDDPSSISLAATVLHNSPETCRRSYTDDQSHLAAGIIDRHVIRDLRRRARA